MDDKKLFDHRMLDLARRAEAGGYYIASHFLTVAEEADLRELSMREKLTPYTLDGGFDSAERKYAIFGDPAAFGYEPTPEALWLKISPKNEKFADELSHRDLLGSLMALGIKRELLGDILIFDNIGYLYVLESIAPYIKENLKKARHTDVIVTEVDAPPQTAIAPPEISTVIASSERLDALVAAVYKLSREKAKAMIEKELCAIDGKITAKPDTVVKAGAIVSLRGFGRFVCEGFLNNTQKGRLRIAVRIYT